METPKGSGTAAQREDQDLDRLPVAAPPPSSADVSPSASGAANRQVYAEDALIVSGRRGDLAVPFPNAVAPSWEERLLADVRAKRSVADRLRLAFSDRLNLRAERDLSFPSRQNVVNEFREGFLSWEPMDGFYIDAGRINLKSGAALGFNPTDFFKTRAVIEPLSVDPSVLREDRLGTFMLQAQTIGRGSALTVAFAPWLARPEHAAPSGFDGSPGRTNAHTRLLIKGSIELSGDFSPELLFYREGGQNKFGANLSETIGQRVVAYAEWAGGKRFNLAEAALSYGEENGAVPSGSKGILPDGSGLRWRNDLSIGASYTAGRKMTFNLEYHFHQAGFSGRNWSNWFRAGQNQPAASVAVGELWFVRAYAQDEEEPMARQAVFLRMDWVDAFVSDLEITGLVNTDVYDGSSLVQLGGDYYLSSEWTVGMQASANLGSKRSDFGSLPQAAGILFKIRRYF
ncbi:MAG TPA: hypothetical protein VFB27_11635 [Opitutaceae bacterium]|nr:hypothetical protein [Opitutaceae bacterium]